MRAGTEQEAGHVRRCFEIRVGSILDLGVHQLGHQIVAQIHLVSLRNTRMLRAAGWGPHANLRDVCKLPESHVTQLLNPFRNGLLDGPCGQQNEGVSVGRGELQKLASTRTP